MASSDCKPLVPIQQAPERSGKIHDYSMNPALVYWEVTRACSLACRHCRADAISAPHIYELTHTEGKALLRQIAAFNRPLPHLILTGGDPLERPDLYDLIDEAYRLGLTTSITPSATPNLSRRVLANLRFHGIESLGLSLDGASAERHDSLRGVEGCFDRTIRAASDAAGLEIPVQINTLVCEETADDLPRIYELLSNLRILRWSLFFLIAVGRGKVLQPLTSEQGEKCMQWIFDLSQTAKFQIKTTEAPFYRRAALRRMKEAGRTANEIGQTSVHRGFGIRDGNGVVFVSSEGNIYPAGFLPLAAGNVRIDHLVDVYRNSVLFRALHNPDQFKGRCGRCEYRTICGGSRSRAFALTGDPLASDPFCRYVPRSN